MSAIDALTGYVHSVGRSAGAPPLVRAESCFTPPTCTTTVNTGMGWHLSVSHYEPSVTSVRPKPPMILASAFGSSQHLLALRYRETRDAPAVSPIDLLLARGWSVWTFDYRDQPTAHLAEPHRATPYGFKDLVEEDLGAVVAHVCAASGAQRVWLGGVSMGGAVAVHYAEAHPDVVAGLVPIEPPLQWNTVPSWLDWVTSEPRWLSLLPSRRLYQLTQGITPLAQFVPGVLRPAWARNNSLDLRAHHTLRRLVGGLPPDFVYAVACWVRDRLNCGADPHRARALRAPVVAIVGERDPIAGPSNVEPFLRAIGTPDDKTRYRVVPKADHYSLVLGTWAMQEVYRPMVAELEFLA